MTEKELSSVKDFAIYNKWVKVAFLKPVDLIGLNLDEIIQFRYKSAEVYPSKKSAPPIGQKLNQPALITFFNFGFKETNAAARQQAIPKWLDKMGAKLVELDEAKDLLTIEVIGF